MSENQKFQSKDFIYMCNLTHERRPEILAKRLSMQRKDKSPDLAYSSLTSARCEILLEQSQRIVRIDFAVILAFIRINIWHKIIGSDPSSCSNQQFSMTNIGK